ncbi:BMP family ABC transporter substrate-binding protein [Brevibacillus humidisoli]|uniref:BMP family lipoprotein n=1 Tax=Brevibacillus humidisoli TaxID=2895522 RepID=UPI001E3FBC5A|nr:BMP family ABC transporter substrate-binding protein [Brevibacillus humidisoli]UFJ42190.1 BMP family ABC transporter substrate-binding protein [Brevibacillus humidisoli]
MKKFFSVLSAATLSLALLLAGCGTANNNQPAENGGNAEQPAPAEGDQAEQPKSDLKVGMVTDVGGVNDNSFNQSAWEGLQKLQQDTGIEVKYLQSNKDDQYIPNLNEFVKNGWDLTWGIGFLMGDHVKQVAEQNPDAKLAIIDAVVEAPNVESITFKEHEGSFLVGVVAASMSKSGKVGFVGGMDIPVIKRFEAGFKAGVKAVKPDMEVVTIYTGAFDKPDEGKSAASTIYGGGADIIFHAAGATGDGVFNEAKDRKSKGEDVWVIGVDKDQSLTFGKEITLTSMVKRVDEAVYRVSKDLSEGKFEGGKPVALGLKENGVGLPETSKDTVPEDVLKKVEEFKQKIIDGEITVPEEPAE